MLIFILLLLAALAAALAYILILRRRLALAEDARSEPELAPELKLEPEPVRDEPVRNQVLELLAHGAPLEQTLAAVVSGMEQDLPGARCSIQLLDEAGKQLSTGVAPSLPDYFNAAFVGVETGLGVAAAGTAAFTGQRVVVEHIPSHPYWTRYARLAQRAGLVACWAEPIHHASGRVLGVLCAYYAEEHLPDEHEMRVAEQAVHLAEIALGRSHADLALRQHEQMLADILENVRAHIYLKDPEGRYLFANRTLRERFAAPIEEIEGYDDSKFFDAGTAAGLREDDLSVLQGGEPLEKEETLLNLLSGVTEVYLTVRIPLKREDGSIYGLCGISTDITERKDIEEHMQHMAQYDTLTHLPNRALFDDRLRLALVAAQRNAVRVALMFIDLDRFKPVNDTHGHAIGDLLLQQAALRIQECLRESDTAARVGGDEFVVLLPSVLTEYDAQRVADKILEGLNRPFYIADRRLEIGCSIGVALFPDHGDEEKLLVKHADIAMYHAKKNGRNNVQAYHPALQPEVKPGA